jgi:restriction endonuclease Mrr
MEQMDISPTKPESPGYLEELIDSLLQSVGYKSITSK